MKPKPKLTSLRHRNVRAKMMIAANANGRTCGRVEHVPRFSSRWTPYCCCDMMGYPSESECLGGTGPWRTPPGDQRRWWDSGKIKGPHSSGQRGIRLLWLGMLGPIEEASGVGSCCLWGSIPCGGIHPLWGSLPCGDPSLVGNGEPLIG